MASDDEIVGLAEAILGAAAQDLEDEGLDRFALRTREALHIVAHATKKGRIPAFNLRGEFNTACRNADVCFTAAERAAFLLPWDGDVS